MAVADRVREMVSPVTRKAPKELKERMTRGRDRMREGSSKRNECLRFWRGDQYVYRGEDGMLISQSTITLTNGKGKPRHRVRTVRNLLVDIVAQEVSSSTQRVPGYEVNPSTSDPEDISAARLGAKVARYGYDKWKLRSVTEKVVTYAVVADEGFAWPFWDSSVGPYFPSEDGTVIGEGEIGVRVLGPNEVYWEPGQSFDESRWHAVEQARALEAVYEMEGYVGDKLTADAEIDGSASDHAKLVLVTDYLERPSPKHPQGRWITFANDKIIVEERPYPCQDKDGNAVDEPVLHKLSYIVDPDSDRDQGLVRHLLDSQRTINDCVNKMLEWKNLALNPQVIIQNGEFKQQLTDEPGAVYHAVGSGQIIWRPVPPIPSELQELKQDAITDMARIAAQNDIPSQVESGKGIQSLLEKDAGRRQAFIGNLAEFHSRLMRHCLYLVQRHYTEDRVLKVRGRLTPETISGFQGAHLRGQADVTVLPGSVEPRTRAAIEARILSYADRGWVSPEAAMAAMNGGTAENLILSYELDVERAGQIIQSIKDGTFHATPPRPVFAGEDPGWAIDEQGNEIVGQMAITVPGWMPRPFDNPRVHLSVFGDWMKTADYGVLGPEEQQAASHYYAALLSIEAMQAAKEAEQQQQLAQGLGMSNAARPQGPPPTPDQAQPE